MRCGRAAGMTKLAAGSPRGAEAAEASTRACEWRCERRVDPTCPQGESYKPDDRRTVRVCKSWRGGGIGQCEHSDDPGG